MAILKKIEMTSSLVSILTISTWINWGGGKKKKEKSAYVKPFYY